MNIQDRLIRSISNKRGNVVLRSELKQFGSDSQVNRVLAAMVRAGMLIRAGRGVLVKTRVSSISGKRIPAATLESVAAETFRKLGVTVVPGRAIREYNNGITTQIPGKLVVSTPRRNISRKLTIAGRTLEYEKNSGST